MKFKRSLLIFLLGIIVGIILSPWARINSSQLIIAPIAPTLADTKELLLPVSEGTVLGLATDKKEILVTEDKIENDKTTSSQFATLINQDLEKKETVAEPIREEKLNQSSYAGQMTVVAVGDSMTDLMGPSLPYLESALNNYYPQAQFNLLNYGVGAENIERGLERIKSEYVYQERHYPPLASVNPDIVVIESFAYNPFEKGEEELHRHWMALGQMVDFIKNNTGAKIIILATIAPAKAEFGQGPAGVNWPQDLAWQHASNIGQYLENAVNFAHSADLPLVDVYHQTLLANGEGNPAYINSEDHIHQNVAGNELISKLLAEKIFSLRIY